MADRDRWREAWATLGVSPPEALFDEIQARYSESHRAYHNLTHVSECLAWFDRGRTLAGRPAEVELAIWFHDAVYYPRRSDNEERSAQWAEEALNVAGIAPDAAARVRDLVLATRHDAEPTTPDAVLLVDVDLAILGAEPKRFDEYERQIRVEYAWVPRPLFRRQRRQVLRGFLDRPSIYLTDCFRGLLEEQARSNLRRSLV